MLLGEFCIGWQLKEEMGMQVRLESEGSRSGRIAVRKDTPHNKNRPNILCAPCGSQPALGKLNYNP